MTIVQNQNTINAMKNILSFLFAFACCCTVNAQNYKLSLNLVKGKDYFQNTNAVMSIKQNVNGMDMNINMTISCTVKHTVTAVVNDVYTMDVSYVNMAMKMDMPTGAMEFNSEKNDAGNPMGTVLSKMINKPFQVKINKVGKILEVSNTESLFSGAFEGVELPEAQREQMKAQLKQSYGDKAFRGSMEMLTGVFPDKPVAKGGTWAINSKVETTMVLALAAVYKLEEVTPTAYVLSSTATVNSENKDAFVAMNGFPMRFDMTGTYVSNVKLDKTSGWVIESKIVQDIKGKTFIKESEQLPQGMTIPMEITGTSTIKGH